MKSWCLNLLTVLIVLVSFQVIDQRNFSFSPDHQIDRLTVLDIFEINPLKESDHKTQIKNYIAQNFFAMVLIAEVVLSVETYFHYLPLYKLIREKTFFLLI